MINYSITARVVNPNLFEINQAKTRINQAKAEGKQPDPKDEALVGTVVTNYFATAQYTEVMGIEKFARHIADHGTTYSRADIMAILYMAVDCMREQLLEGKKIRLGELGDFSPCILCVRLSRYLKNPAMPYHSPCSYISSGSSPSPYSSQSRSHCFKSFHGTSRRTLRAFLRQPRIRSRLHSENTFPSPSKIWMAPS